MLWAENYPVATKRTIDSLPWSSIPAFVEASIERYERRLAFTQVMGNGMNGRLTFGDIRALSDDFAVYLREVLGVQRGDRVALMMPNCLAYPVAAFGVLKAGAIIVNTNPLYTPPEMIKQFRDAEPKVLVVIDMFADRLAEVLAATSVKSVVTVSIGWHFPRLIRGIIFATQKYWNRDLPDCPVAHQTFDEAIRLGRRAREQRHVKVGSYWSGLSLQDSAALQYTGGTTGTHKAAVLSHGNLLSNTLQVKEMLKSALSDSGETLLTALPLYHIFAFTGSLLIFFQAGAHNVLIPNPRPLSNLKRAFENYGITWMAGVNTLFNGLNHEVWFTEYPPKKLKASIAGGMSLQKSVADRWKEITGTEIVEGYGLTESSPVLSFNPVGGKNKRDSIGMPIPSTVMKCVDESGAELPIGSAGEIWAKGPQVMQGYWRKPTETEAVVKDGWLKTGDIGVMDSEGYFKIVDRKKDMILVSGFNVYPNEVEAVLATHPGVLECAVIGVSDNSSGEAVKAFVVKKDSQLSSDSVIAHCRQSLTGYKVPRIVEFRSELPKTPVGKILRRALREGGN